MVTSSEEKAVDALHEVLRTRSTLTIGVSKHELMLNAQALPTAMNSTKELAGRLHKRGVGALTFHAGVDLDRLQQLIAWLVIDNTATDASGATAPDALPEINGIIVGRVAYDALMLGDAEKSADASMAALWQALAQIATDGTGRQYGFGTHRSSDVVAATGDDESALDVMLREEEQITEISASLQTLVAQPELAPRTAMTLMNLAAQGAQAPPELRAKIGERLSHVIEQLGDSSFAPIIRALGRDTQQQEFMLQVVDVLPVLAVSNWLQVAAGASEQQLSHHLLRLMMKLSQHASRHREGMSDATFRSAAKELVEGWVLSDPNPEEHVRLLDQIAVVSERHRLSPEATTILDEAPATEAARVLQMSLEIDVVGDDTRAAVTALIASGSLPMLFEWLALAGPTESARLIREQITAPAEVKRLLQRNPVNADAARALLGTIDMSMADTLLEALAVAESREARELIVERLRSFGEPMRATLIARLDGATWFFARNLLSLLRELIVGQKGTHDVSAMLKFLDHENPQVRGVAVGMLLEMDPVRDAVIRRGLLDDDARVVETVLDFIDRFVNVPRDGRTHSVSSGVAGHLMRFADSEAQKAPFRAIAIRSAATTQLPAVRDWLLGHVLTRSPILRRRVLAKPSLLTATALGALQQYYSHDPEVAPALALARGAKAAPSGHSIAPRATRQDTP